MVSHAWPTTLRESDRLAEFRELLELLVFVQHILHKDHFIIFLLVEDPLQVLRLVLHT